MLASLVAPKDKGRSGKRVEAALLIIVIGANHSQIAADGDTPAEPPITRPGQSAEGVRARDLHPLAAVGLTAEDGCRTSPTDDCRVAANRHGKATDRQPGCLGPERGPGTAMMAFEDVRGASTERPNDDGVAAHRDAEPELMPRRAIAGRQSRNLAPFTDVGMIAFEDVHEPGASRKRCLVLRRPDDCRIATD
jgi:hypothetical protein